MNITTSYDVLMNSLNENSYKDNTEISTLANQNPIVDNIQSISIDLSSYDSIHRIFNNSNQLNQLKENAKLENHKISLLLDFPQTVLGEILSFVPTPNLHSIILTCKYLAVIITGGPLLSKKVCFDPQALSKTKDQLGKQISFFDLALKSRRNGGVERFFKLYTHLLTPEDFQNGFSYACENGKLELFHLLINDKRVDPADLIDEPFRLACANGHLEVVQVLLTDKRVEPTAFENHAIKLACEEGHLEVVKVLLKDKRANPTNEKNEAIETIQVANDNGHFAVVKVLLEDERINPTNWDYPAIQSAKKNGYLKIVAEFVKSKVSPVKWRTWSYYLDM